MVWIKATFNYMHSFILNIYQVLKSGNETGRKNGNGNDNIILRVTVIPVITGTSGNGRIKIVKSGNGS